MVARTSWREVLIYERHVRFFQFWIYWKIIESSSIKYVENILYKKIFFENSER